MPLIVLPPMQIGRWSPWPTYRRLSDRSLAAASLAPRIPAADLPTPPLLAVEVISPSSGLRDRGLKKAVYERMGVPSYWIVEPDHDRPVLTALELRGSPYLEVAVVTGRESWNAARSFPVEIIPADLVAGLRP